MSNKIPETETSKNTRQIFTKNRLEALVDGIFAFAMTLLVVNLTIPRGTAPAELGNTLLDQLDGFYAYAISFLLLARFWVAHHRQFEHIKRIDDTHVWINIFLLLFVALMPFSTSLIANYSTTISEVFFGGNLLILGVLMLANWVYATSGYRLVEPNLDQYTIKNGIRRSLAIPIVAAITMVVSVFYPLWSTYIYLLLFVLFLIPIKKR